MSINKLEECLTTHEIEFLKKIDEYDNIKEGFNLVALLDQIPKDIPAFLDRFNKEIPDNPAKVETALKRILKEDPVFFKQVIAFYTALRDLSPIQTKVEKVSKKEMKKQEEQQALDIITKKLKSI